MKDIIWLGTEAAYDAVMRYETQFKFDKVAYSRTPFDEQPFTDPTFGVMSDRIGLYLMEKVGDTTVIKVHGSMVPSYSRWHTWFPGEVTSYEALKDALQILMESGEKKALMDFSTGGGAVRGLDTVSSIMQKVRKSGIRLDGHTDDSCFSAGYWLMSGCRQITASKMAEEGSIGTLAVVRTYANTEENMGVKFTVFRAGQFKALGNPFEDLSEEAKAYLQKNVEQTNQFFLDHVAANRSLQMSEKNSWAEGRTFHTGEAIKVGLVDKIATLDDLIGSGAAAKNLSDNRRFEMTISAEKLAQIAAGADPKAVLNDAELKQYNTDLEAAEAAQKKAEEDAKKGDDTGTKKDDEEEEEAPEKDAKTPPASTSMSEDYKLLLKENGKLEAKMEALTAQLEAKDAELVAAKASADQLLVLGQAAVLNLQRATRSPIEAKSSPTAVLDQYNELSSKMAAMFKTGQQSQESPTADSTKNHTEVSGNLRFKQPQNVTALHKPKSR